MTPSPAPSVDPETVAFAGVLGQRALLREGRLTAGQLLDLSLARIERLDPVLNAFRTVFHDGARDDLVRLVDPSATEPRTRAVAALGQRIPAGLVRRARRWGDAATARLATLPGGADVLVTPVLPDPPALVGAQTGLRTVLTAGRVVPFTPAWNVTGQPAMSLPAGHTDEGLPLAVQLVARPGEEDLLLGLAAQLEDATSFADRRPVL
jgi:amidase